MDSRNRALRRALRADATLEAKAAFVAAGVRSGQIPEDLVVRASMVSNKTAMLVMPHARNMIRKDHTVTQAISDYLLDVFAEDQDLGGELLERLILWASKQIKNIITENSLKIGKRSAFAQMLRMASKGLYPTRVEDFQDLQITLREELAWLADRYNQVQELPDAPTWDQRENQRRYRGRLSAEIAAYTAMEFLWDIVGWASRSRSWTISERGPSITTLLYWLSRGLDLHYPEIKIYQVVRSLCDALMGLPYE